MAQPPNRSRKKRPRRRPVLRHHLEDEFDQELDKQQGARRAQARDQLRRSSRYVHLAFELLGTTISREVDDPLLEGIELLSADLHPGGGLMTLRVGLPSDPATGDRALDAADPFVRESLTALEGRLRDELCLHLPRRRVPDVRVVVAEAFGG